MSEDRLPFGIKQWAEEDRPREKLMLRGKDALTDAELIAILISTGNSEDSAVTLAQKILDASQNNLLELSRLNVKELTRFKGIGEAKAISIIAALELGRRRQRSIALEKPVLKFSKDSYDYLQASLSDLGHEEFVVVYLSKSLNVLTHSTLSRGGVAGTAVDIKIILKTALEKLASYIIVAHNHPSGNVKPSQVDIEMTKKLKAACHTMEIGLNDHLIIGHNTYYSFSDNGML